MSESDRKPIPKEWLDEFEAARVAAGAEMEIFVHQNL